MDGEPQPSTSQKDNVRKQKEGKKGKKKRSKKTTRLYSEKNISSEKLPLPLSVSDEVTVSSERLPLPLSVSGEVPLSDGAYVQHVEKPSRTHAECLKQLLHPHPDGGTYEYWREFFSKFGEIPYVLEHHKIRFLLREKGKVSKNRVFKCTVCDTHFTNLTDVNKHINHPVHISYLHESRMTMSSCLIPRLPLSMKKIISSHLEEVASYFTLNAEDILLRQHIKDEISEILNKYIPGCSLNIYGSTLHGMGLKKADLNLGLVIGPKLDPAVTLTRIVRIMGGNSRFRNLRTNFNAGEPYITFLFDRTTFFFECRLTINNENVNALSRLLFQYSFFDKRVKTLCILLRLWGKVCKIDNPEVGFLPPCTFYIMVLFYILHCHPLFPVIPDTHLNEFLKPDYKVNECEVGSSFDDDDDELSLYDLWLEMLSYYSSGVIDHKMIYITQTKPNVKKAQLAKNQMLVFNPFTSKIMAQIYNNNCQQYIVYCFKTSHYYYAVPQTREGPIFGAVRPVMYPDDTSMPGLKQFFMDQNTINSCVVKLIPFIDANYQYVETGERDKLLDSIWSHNSKNIFVNVSQVNPDLFDFGCKKKITPDMNKYRNMIIGQNEAQYLINTLDHSKLFYLFNEKNFTLNKPPPICCALCLKDHLRSECPSNILPPLDPLPDEDESLPTKLNIICTEIYEKYSLTDNDINVRNEIASDIEEYLKIFYRDAVVKLFGSSKNGFGIKGSDVDLCICFKSTDISHALSTWFDDIYYKLLLSRHLSNLVFICTARVPIIKFCHEPTGLQGDISLSNFLALENTELLSAYSEIDMRVKILGTMMKRFTKVCNIGDASKGGMSSYCYTLMVIFYLQRVDPPVLPVLQMIHPSTGPLKIKFVEECNCYFFKDIKSLPEYADNPNHKSVGELWIDMLRFYTEDFNFEKLVVSIRSTEYVRKFDKLWLSKNIAIEDPFNKEHNLASTLSRKMNLYIIKLFRKARLHFTTVPPSTFTDKLENYYFDPEVFAEVQPPNDRGCFVCKSVEHQVKNCPLKLGEKENIKVQLKNSKQQENIDENQLSPQEDELSPHKEPHQKNHEMTTETFNNIDFEIFINGGQSPHGVCDVLEVNNSNIVMKVFNPRLLPHFNTTGLAFGDLRRKQSNSPSFTQIFTRQLGSGSSASSSFK